MGSYKLQFRSPGFLPTLLLHILLPKRSLRMMLIAGLAIFCLAGNLNAYIFEHGFENGGYSPFDFQSTTTNDSVTYVTSKAHSGSYSAKCTIDDVNDGGSQATLWKAISDQTRLYMRAYFYLDSAFYTSDNVTLMEFLNGWSNIISVSIKDDDTLYLYNSVTGLGYGFGTGHTMSHGTWHALEMMVDISAGEARFWLDGVLDIEATGINLGANPVNRVSPGGIYWSRQVEANTIYLDDVVVDTQYIGLGGALSVFPDSISVFVGNDATATISGGTGPYTASGYNSSIDVDISGTTLTVTGVSEDTTTITVEDSVGESVSVGVTVTQALAASPSTVSLYMTEGADQATVAVSGGKPGYTATSGNSAVATASVSGSTITITAESGGTVTVTITDALDNHVYVTVVVGDSISIGLGDCPAPPFSTEGMEPNVLIIFDTSGSMDEDDGDGVTRFDEAKEALLQFLAANTNIRFGLMRLDGTPWKDPDGRPGGVVGNHNAIKGGRVLVPPGTTGSFATSAEYIINYINTYMPAGVYDWRDDTGARHWTNLAETLADAGRYFATVVDGENHRLGKGPAGFGYYKEGTDYTFYYDADHDGDLDPFLASLTDDHGNSIDTTSPLQHSCEQAYVIMFTDGEANCENDWDLITDYIGDYDGDNDPLDCKRSDPEVIRPGISDPNNAQYGLPLPGAVYPCDTRNTSDDDDEPGQAKYLDDVAKFLYDHDMRSDIPGMQNMITYTIGFHHADDLLEQAAVKGGGQYFTANTIDELTNAMQAALADIMSKVASGTAVSTITTSSTTDDYLIRAKFLPAGSWRGYLERFTLPYEPDTEGYGHDWEAGEELNDRVAKNGHTNRKIYTFMSSEATKKQEFKDATPVNIHLADLWNEDAAETGDIIRYIRGDTTYDGDKYKDRQGWLLGDIIYSTPISVGAPRAWLFGSDIDHPEKLTYSAFRTANAGRKTIIYVGANDGMLHAFDNEDGDEEWAFIPENLHSKLLKLTEENCHQYFVDLTPVAADVYDGSKWLTILIGGNRLGGQEYFALDVTDPGPTQFSPLWDKIPFNGRMSSTVPAIGKVKANNGAVDSWAAIITSGYTSTDITGEIAALDIATGQKLNMWKILGPAPYWDDDRNTQAKAAGSPYYTLSSPAVLDSDMDGYLDLIYAGDTEGTLWKFYYDYEQKSWERVELFHATDASGNPQAITATPALAFSNAGKYLRIYFGTGKYMEESDKADSTQNGFYCLIEERQSVDNANRGHFTGTTTIDKADLGNVSSIVYSSDFFDAANEDVKINALANGWYFYLDHQAGNPSERVLAKPLIAAKYVFFTSFAPNQDVCGFGGDARLYAVEYLSGTVDDDESERPLDIGMGIPSRPVYYLDPTTLKTTAFIQTTDATAHKPNLDLEDRSLRIETWQTNW